MPEYLKENNHPVNQAAKKGLEEPMSGSTVLPTGGRRGGEIGQVADQIPTPIGQPGRVPIVVESRGRDEIPPWGTRPTIGLPEEAGSVECGDRSLGTTSQPTDCGNGRLPVGDQYILRKNENINLRILQ